MGRAVDQNAGRSKDRAFHVLGRDFSSGSTFSADCLTAFVQPSSVCNRMRQEMHVHTLKIPNTGSHAVAWTHENAAHAGKNGYTATLAAAVHLPRKSTRNFPQGVNEVFMLRKDHSSLKTVN